uniref:Glycosyltransferase family 92 protein n=1 Tax=Leptobrachium leishanense TaxID=445787 RepID=A0A8C5Q196_9ANUR
MKTCASIKHACKLFSLVFSMVTFLYVVYFVVLEKSVSPGGSFRLTLFKDKAFSQMLCTGNWTGGTIIKVKNSQTFVISAYLDVRSRRVVRIIGITYRYEQAPLFCEYCFGGNNETVPAEVEVHSDHFEFPYGTADLLCNLRESQTPQYVCIHEGKNLQNTFLKVHNTEQADNPPYQFEYDFLMCTSALFGSYNNILQFVQAMEMYRILGVQKVVIYHTDSSSELKKVLAHYIEHNFLELIPWPITSYINVSSGWHYPEHPGDLHYYGQTAALNDCIYRYMYKTRYMALHDLDELILPTTHKNWPELVEHLQQMSPSASVFIFENHVFPITFTNQSKQSPEGWRSVPGVNILTHDRREPNNPTEYNPTKMILNPRNVIRTSVHVALEFVGEEFRVPRDVAQLCHYREPKQSDLTLDMLIKDDILSRLFYIYIYLNISALIQQMPKLQHQRAVPKASNVWAGPIYTP